MYKVFNPQTGNYYPNLDDGAIIIHRKPNGAIASFEMPMHRAPEFDHRTAYTICAMNPGLSYHPSKP